jgi:genome maintenance exonuclease 1
LNFTYCTPKNLDDLKSETFPDGKRLYTLPDGSKVPSVTTVLGAQKKQSIMEWRKRVGEEEANRISRKASSRGTNVHRICEEYLNNNPDHIKKAMPDSVEMFFSIKPYLNKINNIHYQEQSLWSTKIQMAGRVDCIAEYDGTLSVIDFKTSSRVKKKEDITDYFCQCTCYSIMYEELIGTPIEDIVIIMAVDNDEPLIFKEKTSNYIEELAGAIKFYNNSK